MSFTALSSSKCKTPMVLSFSPSLSVESGILKGSPLGCVLFSIFANDMYVTLFMSPMSRLCNWLMTPSFLSPDKGLPAQHSHENGAYPVDILLHGFVPTIWKSTLYKHTDDCVRYTSDAQGLPPVCIGFAGATVHESQVTIKSVGVIMVDAYNVFCPGYEGRVSFIFVLMGVVEIPSPFCFSRLRRCFCHTLSYTIFVYVVKIPDPCHARSGHQVTSWPHLIKALNAREPISPTLSSHWYSL